MNKNILFIMVLSWVLAGCASYAPSNGDMFGETGTLSVTGCDIQLEVEPCDATDVNNPKVELDLDTWILKPECVQAKKGKTITVKLKSSKSIVEDTVVVFPKEVENYFWLAKTNSPSKNVIKIKVKKKKPTGKELPEGIYRYGIWTKDKCIDPRVDVKN
ncbi:MAG: hypothetical protein WBM76_09055 [Woeseiaceae bacterium]